ncbi:hypothetical protein D0T87_24455, partial [Bacteroides sp. 51]|nr:hypothetical protein [Bacteroides sp. 51]
AVVNDFNADYPLDFYNFFKEIGCHYIQFSPIVVLNRFDPDPSTLNSSKQYHPCSIIMLTEVHRYKYTCFYLFCSHNKQVNWLSSLPALMQ